MIANSILYIFSKQIRKCNKKFIGIHKGESCYIFGNGASLKYFDLKKFSDKIALGLGALFVHKEFEYLQMRYCYEGQPFFFYPYWSNPYRNNKFEKNIIGRFYKERFLSYPNIIYFMSLSNYFGINGSNKYFVHHFNQPFNGFHNCLLNEKFTSMSSGLAGIIGIAICLGFKDITLVGYDYSMFPQAQGHFYEYGGWFENTYWGTPVNKEVLLAAMQHANIRIVTPNDSYRGHILPGITYKTLTGDEPCYRENNEICENSGLLRLNEGRMSYKIFPPEFSK